MPVLGPDGKPLDILGEAVGWGAVTTLESGELQALLDYVSSLSPDSHVWAVGLGRMPGRHDKVYITVLPDATSGEVLKAGGLRKMRKAIAQFSQVERFFVRVKSAEQKDT